MADDDANLATVVGQYKNEVGKIAVVSSYKNDVCKKIAESQAVNKEKMEKLFTGDETFKKSRQKILEIIRNSGFSSINAKEMAFALRDKIFNCKQISFEQFVKWI